MTNQIRYYRILKGSAYWTPGKWVEQFDLPACKALGKPGPDAMVAAIEWNKALDAARNPKPNEPAYKPGSLGHFYARFQRTVAWEKMKPRTREDYERCWPEIERRFGHVDIDDITPDMSERFHADIHPIHNDDSDYSWNQAHRILKVWRTLLNALVVYELRDHAPIGRLSNPVPKGRDSVWTHDEVMRLSFGAALIGKPGIAAAIRLAWGAALSPVDVWTLERIGWRAGASGKNVMTRRGKTGKRVWHACDDDTLGVVDAYLETLPQLTPTARIIRRSDGKPYRDTDSLSRDFRDVRAFVFGADEERQFLDLRRSALTEARLGGATKDDIGAAAANTLDQSAQLEETYLVGASERVLQARIEGRAKIAAKNRK